MEIIDSLGKAPFSLTGEQRRLREAYQRRWKAYIGQVGYYGEDAEDNTIVVNYTRALVNKINDFMFGRGFKFTGNNDLWPFAEPIIQTIWRGRSKSCFGIELGQMGGVMGDAYVKVWWDSDPYSTTYNTVQFSVLPSTMVVPIWEPGRTGKDRKMLECRTYSVEEEYGHGSQEPTKTVYTHQYTASVIRLYRNEVLVAEEPNVLGEIPIVHIQNQPLAGSFYGVSDIEDLMLLQDQINSKITGIGKVVDYYGEPMTLAYGIRKGQIEVGPNNISYLPRRQEGVSIENLDRSASIRDSVQYLTMLKEDIHEMASVPEASLGKMQPVSNTSGVALHMQYQPIMHLVERKVSTYGAGLAEITRMGIKMYGLFSPNVVDGLIPIEIGPSVRNADSRIEMMYPVGTSIGVHITSEDWRRLDLQVEWPQVLPKDTLMELEMARTVQSMGLLPDRIILEKIIRAGVVDIPLEEVDEALSEARMDAAMRAQAQMGGYVFGGYGMTGQNEMGPGSGSAMQAPAETVEGSAEDQQEDAEQ